MKPNETIRTCRDDGAGYDGVQEGSAYLKEPIRKFHWVPVRHSFDSTAILVDDETRKSCGKIRPLEFNPKSPGPFESSTASGKWDQWSNEEAAKTGVMIECQAHSLSDQEPEP